MDIRPDVVASVNPRPTPEPIDLATRAALQNPIVQYDIKTHDLPFVVIQHDPSAKVAITDIFKDIGHTVITTDLNFTGMIWSDQSLMSLLNLETHREIHLVFLPFKMRRWPDRIPSNFTRTDVLAKEILYNNKYLVGVVEKFKNRDLFGHLNISCMRVGVRVHCFWGSATNTARRVREEIGWVLQFEANRNGLSWRVQKYESRETSDITLVVSISEKCCFFGIEVRRPRDPIPGHIAMEGIMYIWPFLHVAETMKVVKFGRDDEVQVICILTYKNALAAFWKTKNPSEPNGASLPSSSAQTATTENICWAPLRWELTRISHLLHDHIPSQPNVEMATWLENVQNVVRLLLHGNLRGVEGRPAAEWIG